jgi:putative Mg2+ transporter-C (MgtC) family protein
MVKLVQILNWLRSPTSLWVVLIKLALAVVIGGIIGMERGKQGRAAGMRTHIFVTVGSALTAMIGLFTSSALGFSSDPMRVSAQVVSGIGFLGVGTILLKGRFQITGLTTAAGLWCTATIGLALGVGFYEGALGAFVASMLVVTILHKLEYKIIKRSDRFGIYVEIDSDAAVSKTLERLRAMFPLTDMQVTAPRSAHEGNVGIEANVHKKGANPLDIAKKAETLEHVVFAIESI